MRIVSSWSKKEMEKNMVDVKTSSNIAGLAYDVTEKQLYVRFIGLDKSRTMQATYIYDNVPLDVYRKFFRVPSKGHYFWQSVRDKFKYRKISK